MKYFSNKLIAALVAGALGNCFVGSGAMGAAPAPAPAAGAPLAEAFELNRNKTDGAAAFDKKDWQTAVTKLEAALTAMKAQKSTENMDLILYMLGSANFNLNAFSKAAEYLKEYESKFPKGEFVNEVSVYLGWAYRLDKKTKEAIGQWEKLKNNEKVRGDIMSPLAAAYEEDSRPGEAMKVLEEYISAGVRNIDQTNAAIQLVKLYLMGDKTEAAVNMLDTIKRSGNAADLILQINVQALLVADKLLDDEPALALRAYQSVRRKSEVLRVQTQRLSYLESRVAELKRSKEKGAAIKISIGEARIAMVKEHLGEVTKQENYDAIVIYRIGRCFDKLHRYPEAELAFRHVYEKYPKFEDRPTALFGQFVALIQMNEAKDAMEVGKKYLKEFPDGANNEEIGQILMSKLLETNEYEKGIEMADQVIALMKDKESPAAKDIKFLRATAQFQANKVDDAIISLTELQQNPPDDSMVKEQIDYMMGLTYFYKNQYTKALAALQEYLTKYPEGYFLDDAQYRLGIVMLGEERDRKAKSKGKDSDYQRVINHAREVLTKYSQKTQIKGELNALIGDCYSEMAPEEIIKIQKTNDKFDPVYEAGKAYKTAADTATNDEVLGYAIDMAKTKLSASGDWAAVREMYQNFVDNHKQHPDRLKGIRELSIAITRDLPQKPADKTADQWTVEYAKIRAERLEEVKKMLSTEALANINRITAEGVEGVLSQLAINCIPKPKPRPLPAATTPATTPPGATTTTTTPAKAPTTPPRKSLEEQLAEAKKAVDEAAEEATKELEKWLPAPKLTPTGEARLLWTKSEIYRMLSSKKGGDHLNAKVDETFKKLSEDFKTDDYSSTLLALVGDYLAKNGDKDKAIGCFNRLKEFKKSDYLDYAYNGLGDVSYAQGDYEGALQYYLDSTTKFPGMKYPFALLGQARCYIKLNKPEEARPPLLEIIPVKEWKGELTAEALFWLGVIEYRGKKYAESLNYFKNLYLSFQKFPEWTALGYLNAIEVTRSLGKSSSDIQLLIEAMLKNKRLTESKDPEVVKLVQVAKSGAPSKLDITFPSKLK